VGGGEKAGEQAVLVYRVDRRGLVTGRAAIHRHRMLSRYSPCQRRLGAAAASEVTLHRISPVIYLRTLPARLGGMGHTMT